MRLSDEAKRAFDQNYWDRKIPFHILDEELIKKALKKCGYSPDKDDSLKAYHLATNKYIEDEEVKNCVVWMKYDKCKTGGLKQGDSLNFADIILADLLGKEILLQSIISQFQPNLILAGSLS